MAIRLVVTRGYGNGTYAGTIPDVVTRGYMPGEVVAPAPAPSGGPSAGASYPRLRHRWPREQKRKKKLYDDFVEALEDLSAASEEAQEAAIEALAPIIGPTSFDLLEERIENVIIVADTRNDIARIRKRLRMIEDIIDDDEVEMLVLH
jgi:hypothetical protein